MVGRNLNRPAPGSQSFGEIFRCRRGPGRPSKPGARNAWAISRPTVTTGRRSRKPTAAAEGSGAAEAARAQCRDDTQAFGDARQAQSEPDPRRVGQRVAEVVHGVAAVEEY